MTRGAFLVALLAISACAIDREGRVPPATTMDAGRPPDVGPGIDVGPAPDVGPGIDAGPRDVGPPIPDVGPVDVGPPDTGPRDAGPPDAAPFDSGPPDSGPPDSGPPDSGPPDSGPPDSGPPDSGPPDSGPPDSGPPDSGPSCIPRTEVCNALDDDCDGMIDDSAGCPCTLRRLGGRPYLFCNTARSWTTARSECMALGYDLVVIDDAAENSFVWSNASGISGVDWWIGLRDSGSSRYVWVDGTVAWTGGAAVAYTNFRFGGSPDGSGDCVEIGNDEGGGTWNDVSCTDASPYICEPR